MWSVDLLAVIWASILSATAVSPLITDWITNKYDWGYIFRTRTNTLSIPANGEVRVDPETYQFPEGSLLYATFVFDSAYCGVRLEVRPNLDQGDYWTVNRLVTHGGTIPGYGIYCRIPPATPAGYYAIDFVKEMPFQGNLRIFLINTDPANAHNSLDFSWLLAVLRQERPITVIELLNDILEIEGGSVDSDINPYDP